MTLPDLPNQVTVPAKLDPNAAKRKALIQLISKYINPGSGSSIQFLKQRTWQLPMITLQQIIPNSPFVIVGGVATRLYMPERMTLDIDILINTQDAQQVYQNLLNANASKISNLSIPGSQWQLEDGTSLDVIEEDSEWAQNAIKSPNYAPDGSPVIQLSYLVLMKFLAGRSQDIADISRMLGSAQEVELDPVKAVITTYLPQALEDLESLIILGKLEYS
ncbi:hypothetical protein [Prochlorothrix hollandica]|uniref:Uncharacterized protein n=1 Tax=Prochlorothrix hollandica PCC 9006 = CALU 1027 TaxID=317619 RepID=A0A0M2PWJ6_PROHO|nr:hypothetical protein [Prochlorothrix hollandica]KKI99043.1 hypothetical protein PROH_14670 [Prochlorothrix hollandica PCC 9006 = CALU 1027]